MNTQDYRLAPGGEGPQAATWADKPHRLIYDLCREVEWLRQRNATLLVWRVTIQDKAALFYRQRRKVVMGQLNAQASVLGFEFHKDDPQTLMDIICDEAPASAREAMFVLVDDLAAIDTKEKELFDALEI